MEKRGRQPLVLCGRGRDSHEDCEALQGDALSCVIAANGGDLVGRDVWSDACADFERLKSQLNTDRQSFKRHKQQTDQRSLPWQQDIASLTAEIKEIEAELARHISKASRESILVEKAHGP
eukprot:IDg10286t1